MGNNIIVITGAIGSGKTYLMKLLSEAYQARGEKVLVFDNVEPNCVPLINFKVSDTNILVTCIEFDRKIFPFECNRIITIEK